jgi:hypothetical protein
LKDRSCSLKRIRSVAERRAWISDAVMKMMEAKGNIPASRLALNEYDRKKQARRKTKCARRHYPFYLLPSTSYSTFNAPRACKRTTASAISGSNCTPAPCEMS